MKEEKYSIWDKIDVRMFCPEFQHLTESPKNQNKKSNARYIFDSIIGYDNIKKILTNTINSNRSISILSGNASCRKSSFLKEIEKFYPEKSYFIDGSRATKTGIFHILFDDTENTIRFLLVDELDKLNIFDFFKDSQRVGEFQTYFSQFLRSSISNKSQQQLRSFKPILVNF